MAIGIVAEYNPFHNGHIRQLNWIKEKFPNEKIIVVMSDKYTQRGELAIASFKQRKAIAMKYGVDKILKLKFEETVQAAHIFAYSAILKLYKHGVDKIVFGSEDDDPQTMIKTAQLMKEKQVEFHNILHAKLKKGKTSYPRAMAETISELGGKEFTKPNDILGFEYIKVIVEKNLPIDIYTIKRNIDFHSEETNDIYASASLIRKMIFNNEAIDKYSPMVFNKKPKKIQDKYSKFQKIVKKTSVSKLKKIPLVSEGIENLFKKNINIPSYDLFVEACTSKRYTSSRIKRIIAWILNKKWKYRKK
ncbi:nucleotidyltransferase [Mycoplasmopsis lipofaciens]|uniref:nucleotidyltransferase n=1 Tax=Mycoplasmopsis lipofaciens TaxID=114884 RepID=UPI00047F181D|nr:nucleotidyltransferase [Mycoplasmopsis lipofaciens]